MGVSGEESSADAGAQNLSTIEMGPQSLNPMVDEEMGSAVKDSDDSNMNRLTDCPVCYETFSDQTESQEDGSLKGCIERMHLRDCHHEFCRECLINHCKHAVSVRDIPIHCPASASDDCTSTLSEELIQELLCRPDSSLQYGSISNGLHGTQENADWARYQRFKRLAEDPSLLTCSSCHGLLSKDENRALDREENKLVCPNCGHAFCSIHGDAHPGMTCDQYKPARQIKKSEKIIRKFTKPCSHCGVPIQKESGCDHIVCTSCKEDMCFKCGTHEHLTGDVVRSCKLCEQNFIDHRHIWAYRLTLCLSLPFYLPLCIMHILLMIVLTTVSFGCFCFFGCGMSVDSKGDTTFDPMKGVRTVFGMIFLPVTDLFRQCGIPCCLGLDLPPELEAAKTTETSFDDDVDIDDDGSGVIDA